MTTWKTFRCPFRRTACSSQLIQSKFQAWCGLAISKQPLSAQLSKIKFIMIAKMENNLLHKWLACSIKISSSLKLRQNYSNMQQPWRRPAFSQWWSTRHHALLNSKSISCPRWAPSRKPSSNSPQRPWKINKLKWRVRKIIEIKTSRS